MRACSSGRPGRAVDMDAKFFDSLFEGDSANGIKLGMGLTGGDFWPRVKGCDNLYRGPSEAEIDFSSPVTVGGLEDDTMRPPVWLEHKAEAVYLYVVRRVSGCGREQQSFAAAVRVCFDEAGELVGPECNHIFAMSGRPVAGGRVELVWYYSPIAQAVGAAVFRVYSDDGTGQIDYDSVIGEVEYDGRRFYRWCSGAIAGLGGRRFCVRAVAKGGLEVTSRKYVAVQLRSDAPAGVSLIQAQII